MKTDEIDQLIDKELSKGWHDKIEGFPERVVRLMLRRQYEQHKQVNISVFELSNLDGFAWHKTKEGTKYWTAVILCKKFNLVPDTDPEVGNPNLINNTDSKVIPLKYKSNNRFTPIKNLYKK